MSLPIKTIATGPSNTGKRNNTSALSYNHYHIQAKVEFVHISTDKYTQPGNQHRCTFCTLTFQRLNLSHWKPATSCSVLCPTQPVEHLVLVPVYYSTSSCTVYRLSRSLIELNCTAKPAPYYQLLQDIDGDRIYNMVSVMRCFQEIC